MVLFCVVLVALLFIIYKSVNSYHPTQTSNQVELNTDNDYSDFKPDHRGELVQHTYYSLSYIEDTEQAEWVYYLLTQDMLKAKNVKRSRRFNRDPLVTTKSAHHRDYTNSGFTRGHMAPAGDMAHNETAMKESFYMSNMCPQIRSFNNGIWKELEEQTRDWVYQNEALHIVVGPIHSPTNSQKIGRAGVAVPQSFYKVILDLTGRDKKALGFIIPHETSDKRLQSYAVTIDDIEDKTGIDFFQNQDLTVLSDLEAEIDISRWKFSEARYKLRVERWNKE